MKSSPKKVRERKVKAWAIVTQDGGLLTDISSGSDAVWSVSSRSKV